MSGTMLYRPGDTFLHRADPRAKIVTVLAVLVTALTTTRLDVLAVLLLAVVAALYLLGGMSVRAYGRGVAVVVPLIAVLVLLQGLLQAGPALLTVAGLTLSEPGVLLALGIGLRLLAMGICFYGFSVSTSPADISLALNKVGVPYKFAYLTSFAFRFLPLLQDEARTLLTAMAVRGSGEAASRSPVRRCRAIVRMLFPMLVGSLKRSGEIALSMELRGYGLPGRRTFVRTLRLRGADMALMGGAFAVAALLIAAGAGAFPLLSSEG
ncbi:energy-coupling factor transporter transmembrane component T [Streptomyces sp. NPDC044780]|uniref:energy-coupling factor transporter transmembrane component T family protein n=1 Tax=unclassified Streptomyces TaxID=2593676 RepID=UPI003403346F